MLSVANKSTNSFACLQPPKLKGWPRVQARLVNWTKRAALHQLHNSQRGEILLLQMYLLGEEAGELALFEEVLSQKQPHWLTQQVNIHLADERKHAQAFAEAMVQRGGTRRQRQPDFMSRRKLKKWKRLAQRYAKHFTHGTLVPAYAIGLCAEQMTVRVLRRHCDILKSSHRFYALLAPVLADENKHIRFCSYTLQRVVAEEELPFLRALLMEIRKIERGFGVSGAMVMYFAGLIYSLRHGVSKLAHQ